MSSRWSGFPSGRNVLSTCFWLLTIFAYARYVHGVTSDTCQGTRTESLLSRVTCHVSRFYVLALLFFCPRTDEQTDAGDAAFVLLLLDGWPWERWRMTSVREWRVRLPGLAWEKAPFFILSGLSCAVTLLVQQHGEAMKFMGRFSTGRRIENVFVSYPRYLAKRAGR